MVLTCTTLGINRGQEAEIYLDSIAARVWQGFWEIAEEFYVNRVVEAITQVTIHELIHQCLEGSINSIVKEMIGSE